MRESIKIRTDNYNFKFRVSGIVINDNKLLLVDMDDSGFLCLPGGYVELGETTEQAVSREMEEELGYKLEIIKDLGVVENFFVNKYNRTMHEICFYYLLKPLKGETARYNDYCLIENDKGHNIKLNFKWININELDKYDVRPKFLKEIIKNKSIIIGHIIFNELNQN